jgi:hypothetical protein
MSGTKPEGQSVLGMSDEDFLNQTIPASEESTETTITAPTEGTTEGTVTQEDDTSSSGSVAPVAPSESTETTTVTSPEAAPVEEASTEASQAGTKDEDGPGEGKEQPDSEAAKAAEGTAPDYQAFYQKVMTPFKANGKMIELRSPEEAVQLMQMGANFTRKMQEIAPHRKVLMMLENNGLLDPAKLSFLIDVEKRNPEAIKKLVKDAGLDPMEIDTSVEPEYKPGNHQVTDEDVSFDTALKNVQSTEDGRKFLGTIHNDWDHTSKELLWKHPGILEDLNQQRESGIYDRIVAEVDRQRTLGTIAPGVSFLHAYQLIGDQMMKVDAFKDLVQPGAQPNPSSSQPVQSPKPAVVATRVAAPKPAVVNGDKASAASPTRTVTSKAQAFVNPLAMSDDDFLKQMANRV